MLKKIQNSFSTYTAIARFLFLMNSKKESITVILYAILGNIILFSPFIAKLTYRMIV